MKECYDQECEYRERRHYHVLTNDGSYIKYIVEPFRPMKEYSDADTRR